MLLLAFSLQAISEQTTTPLVCSKTVTSAPISVEAIYRLRC
jgi:hypothetical protein